MMNPNRAEDNREFRQSYRQSNIGKRYSGALHLSFTLSFTFCIVFWAVWRLDEVIAIEYLTIPVTFLYANLVEYFMHKGPMHRPFNGLRIIYQRHATQHHIFFTDRFMQFDSSKDLKAVLFPPLLIAFFLILFAVPAGWLVDWVFGSNIACLFIATAFAYFALYEIMHTLYHVSELSSIYRFRLFKHLRQLHKNHHRIDLMNRYNFNITFPIGDFLFGTYYYDDETQSSCQQVETKQSEESLH